MSLWRRPYNSRARLCDLITSGYRNFARTQLRILYNLYGSFNYKLFTHVRSLDPYANMFRIAELLSDGVIITHCIGIQVLLVYTPLQRLSFILLLLRTFFCFYFSSLPTLELSTEVFCCKPGTYKSCIPLQRFSFIFLFAFYLTCTQSDSGHLQEGNVAVH